MSEFLTFLQLGFRHITDVNALDHILFLLALAAIYRLRDWRRAIWVITAFTVGHSVTLALAVSGAVRLPTDIIEFLIPLTIVAACIENILVANRNPDSGSGRFRPLFAGLFGLVHGAGFANYLRDLFVDRIALPLFGFNVGIELGQLVVLMLAGILFAAADWLISIFRGQVESRSVLRLRILVVSCLVMVVAARWAVERRPW